MKIEELKALRDGMTDREKLQLYAHNGQIIFCSDLLDQHIALMEAQEFQQIAGAPAIGSVWEHRNGAKYTVIGYTNADTEYPDRYPQTIVYQGVANGLHWSCPLSEWDGLMRPLPEPPEAINSVGGGEG